ncbi:MAG TPA: type II toxin-antitoxin system HipA family toxin [Bryobacteraceae bacterium]|jgi:serine/threonine-protein kinase HipA
MKPDPKLNALEIHLHGEQIGIITRLAGDQYLFAFEEEYAENPNRPALSLSFKSRGGGLLTAARTIRRRLPSFFSNLLPEGHLREYLAQHAGVKAEREFFLLAALGQDLPGALTATPLSADGDHDVKHREPEQSRDDSTLRFSLAGVQLKFSAVMEATGGLTIPTHGVGGSWIVKLPSLRFPAVPENEFTMMELARAAGIQVPETRLVPVSAIGGLPADVVRTTGNAFTIRRFDRANDGAAIHMEDFAQVFGLFPEDKYKRSSYSNIASVLWRETGQTGIDEFIRRLVFSILIGNGDMHLKNWSLLYPDRRTPVLSPAYDFVATAPCLPGDKLALSFGKSKSLEGITLDQIRRFAETAELPVTPIRSIARETVDRTLSAWEKLEQKDLLPAEIRTAIDGHIRHVARSTHL